MKEMKWPSDIRLFHGTSADLLDGICRNGLGRGEWLEDLGAKKFLRTVMSRLEYDPHDYANGRTARFQNAYFSSVDFNQVMNYRRGLYATTSACTAASYATRAPEILYYCECVLEDCYERDMPIIQNTLLDFPELKKSLFRKRRPIVLELLNVPLAAMKTENGSEVGDDEINKIRDARTITIDINWSFEITSPIASSNLKVWMPEQVGDFGYELKKLPQEQLVIGELS